MNKPHKTRRSAAAATDWTITKNDRRKRKMVTLTLAPETVEALDEIWAERSRGAVVDELVAAAAKKARK